MSSRLSLSHFIRRVAKSTRIPATAHSPRTASPPTEPLEEELLPSYNAKHFFPVHPKKVFHEKYETIAKLGFGSSSTAWLARDLFVARSPPDTDFNESEPYVVLKFCTRDYNSKEAAQHELQVCQRLAMTNPAHRGIQFLRMLIENFELVGPNGSHICLVFEPLRETLSLFQSRLKKKRFTLMLMKAYLACLLKGLDYLHSECHIIHADLKLDNILVNFEDQSVLDEFAEAQSENPMLQKRRDGHSIYQSHNQFGPLRVKFGPIHPIITDFSHAQWIDNSQPQINPIQHDCYRAPEVILGIGWSYSADIWNLGLLLWNMLEGVGRDLFTNIHSSDGIYLSKNHLAQMIALLGPPPKQLLSREQEMRKWNFAPPVENDENKLCHKPIQFYKGPFFDDEGLFMYPDLIPTELNFDETLSSIEAEEKRAFLDFVVKNMLCWVPEQRKTAKELLRHPWLWGPWLDAEDEESITAGYSQ